VRQDLCARHKERHTARGSQLLRKENFINNLNPIVTAAMQAQRQSLNQAKGSAQTNPAYAGHQAQMRSPGSAVASTATMSPTPLDPNLQSPSEPSASLARAQSDGSYQSVEKMDPTSHSRAATFSAPGASAPFAQQRSFDGYNATGTPTPQYPRSQMNNQTAQSPSGFVANQGFPPLTQLPPPGYATMSQPSTVGDGNNFTTAASDNVQAGMTTDTFMDGMTPTSYAIPMFGGESYTRSPFAMADDFAAWLFNDQNFGGANASPMAYPGAPAMAGGMGTSANFSLQAPYFNHDPMANGYFSQPMPPQHPMAVNNLIDTNMQQTAMSEERRQQILDLIETQFNDTTHAPVSRKEDIFEGNRDDDNHVLSLRMMQHYIGSYWKYFHPQMPILHKPTFSANTCPELLLIAVMALGASCLEKTHGYEVTQKCADFAGFLAWHLRWAIFMDADFRPPAKLWIFQALLLLEIFEKMYSTRPLHERSHIHHATTLTLMRRGSSLIGRSSVDSPPSGTTNSRSGSVTGAVSNGSGSTNQFTPDEWWNQWITNEATRRVAFAAFVMDSIHATMFGHSAVMVAHEMRLPLPCDEALWSATSSAEVGRVEQSLHQNGIKPTTFLDGLKRTLNGQSVRTNSFGRTILMAGLLSVSWHMNQRDLQVSSLGVTQALGGRDKWRGSLTRAFDFWKLDLDESIAKNEGTAQGYGYTTGRLDDENVFESRTVLHHLAHMAMHVDIVDCQIFAGAHRLLGRGITPQDYNGAQRRMKEGWAPTARARDATFYALRFLCQVLLGGDSGQPGGMIKDFTYSARDDYLLNRPWVLYFATLIVWSYGYALDGPVRPLYALNSQQEVIEDMQGFLRRVGGVRAPDDLATVKNRNACLGLLILMRDTFKAARWELLHEAGKLLTKCIDMLSAPST
jgi:Fungal specific transcription factor domain